MKHALILCGMIAAFFLSGCGYRMGNMMHPQIKTIAFAEIRNDSKEPLLTPVMRNQLAARFQFDNSLSIKTEKTADCILYCRIISTKTRTIREDSTDGDRTYRPTEFEITIKAEFTVLIPGKSEPLIPTRQVSASAKYQYNADPTVGTYYGMRQCAFELANQIVQYTTEAW